MENYIPISYLNDFTFCPRSIYLHSVYQHFDKRTYQGESQTRGTEAHKAVDEGRYSSRKDVYQGLGVYSEELGLVGRVDVYDAKKKLLTERKYQIKQLFPGYELQLYAQYFCLLEMGYEVNELKLYSMQDNKNYPVPLPGLREKLYLKMIAKQIRSAQKEIGKIRTNEKKCDQCIYKQLCHE